MVFLKINKQTSSNCHVVRVTRVQQPCISFSIIMKGTIHTTELTWVGKKRNICTLGNWWCERWVRFWVSHSCSAKAPILASRVTTFLRLEIYANWYYQLISMTARLSIYASSCEDNQNHLARGALHAFWWRQKFFSKLYSKYSCHFLEAKQETTPCNTKF